MGIDPSGWFGAVTASVIACALWVAIVALYNRVRLAVSRQRPAIRYAITLMPPIVFISLNASVHKWLHNLWGPVFWISAIGVTVIVWQEARRYALVGLIGIDKTLTSGISPARSLKMCSISLDFLGVGASKLSSTGLAFEEAIQRCSRPGRPIRFLLCSPRHKDLERIARQAGVVQEKYRENVSQSLDIIARLKRERERNIEVRFYDALPLFRLMFIDDELCLASHYYFGENDGSQLPQLHIRKIGTARDTDSLYFPLHEYFDLLWNDAKEWDFQVL